jgi:hypothetical protein
MLAGRPAFEGEDVTEILGSIVKLEPAWGRLPVSTPQAIRTLLRRCLQKDRTKRLQHMGDARLEIVDLENGRAADGSPDAPVPAPRRERLLVGLLAVTTLAAVGLAIPASRSLRQPSLRALPEMRFQIPTPPTTAPFSYALSPDASTIVFVATSDSRSVLWKQRLDTTVAEPLRGTEGATLPFWSPDHAARQPVAASTAATAASVNGSVGVVSKKKLEIRRVAQSAAPTPVIVPIAIGIAESHTICATTWPGRAPNAIRTPISRVRRVTANAVMPNTPTRARAENPRRRTDMV